MILTPCVIHVYYNLEYVSFRYVCLLESIFADIDVIQKLSARLHELKVQ